MRRSKTTLRYRLVTSVKGSAPALVLALMVLLLQPSLPGPHSEASAGGADFILNGKEFPLSKGTEEYTFLAAGHIYGSPGNRYSVHPSPTILASIDRINREKPEFFLSLGDMVRISWKGELSVLKDTLIRKIDAPFINVVGNHDISEEYFETFGLKEPYYYSFTRGSVRFILLDTETGGPEIKGGQLEFLGRELKKAEKDNGIKNIFVISHKLFWIVGDDRFKDVFRHVNNYTTYSKSDNYMKNVKPVLERVTKKLYLLSGDIGVHWSLPALYEEDGNITYLGVGVGDSPADVILKVDVAGDNLSLSLIPIGGAPAVELKRFSSRAWKNYFEKTGIISPFEREELEREEQERKRQDFGG